MLPQYATGPHDPHPNAGATALVAPLLVNEVFDHSIVYENLYGIKKLGDLIPEEYNLSQNYPNPFNPATKIGFELPRSSFVNLCIYDIMGRKVETLVNEQLAAGSYEADFHAVNISNGIYYYSLNSGDFTRTRKMVLIK
jgi:hypothetical protein